MANTGVSATLTNEDVNLKWNVAAAPHGNWKVTRIGGLGRSVIVIDDSYLGIDAGKPKQYCFGDLHELSPITVDAQVDPDNTTIFPTSDQTAGNVPVPLGGAVSGTSWILTLPAASGNGTTLAFTGAIISDSGIELVNNDRLRSTFQVQPDGKTFTWNGNT